MTEHDDLPEEAHASVEEEQRVSALLAGAAATDPVPADVATRLDDVLAGLVAERDPAGPAEAAPQPGDEGISEAGSGTTDLASRRRRRLWPGLLVAAATVSVVGLGIGNLADLTGGSGAGDASTAESAAGGALEDGAEPDASVLSGQAAPESEERMQADPYPSLATAPRLRTSSATVDLQRIEDFSLAVPVGDSADAWARMCVRPDTRPGDEWLPVRLDGDPGVLVLRAPAGGRRTAEVFTCEDADSPALATEVRAAR